MIKQNKNSGVSLIQVIISLVIGAFIIGSLGKLMMNVFQSQSGIKRQASFENVKTTLKEVLKGCDFDFQIERDGAFNSINFKNFDGEKDYFVATNRITAKERPIVDFGQKLTNGLEITRLNLMDSGLAPKEEDGGYYKYIVWLDFEARDPDGKRIKVIEPHIYFTVFADGDGKFSACLPGEEEEEEEADDCADVDSDEDSPHAVGEGKAEKPYVICTADQLNNIGDGTTPVPDDPAPTTPYMDAHFILGSDILLTDSQKDGSGFHNSIGGSSGFKGKFDGQGYTISNFTNNPNIIGAPAANGFFTEIKSGAEVKNLVLKNFRVSAGTWASGGLAGNNEGTVRNSCVIGINEGSRRDVGGLVGANYGLIENSCAMVIVTCGNGDCGGLVARNGNVNRPDSITIRNSFATGIVTGGGSRIAGLVSINYGLVENSFSNVELHVYSHASGLVQLNSNPDVGLPGRVLTSYSLGSIDPDSRMSNVGGLVGTNQGLVSSTFSKMTMPLRHAAGRIGGLVGENTGTVEFSFYSGTITNPRNETGGLVGHNESKPSGGGIISNSYSEGTITGLSEIGGLVGTDVNIHKNNSITNVYSTMNVSAAAYPTSDVGGLIAKGSGPVTNAYATGDVTGRGTVGGFSGGIGCIYTGSNCTVSNVFATGTVFGNYQDKVGPITGNYNLSSFVNAYFLESNCTNNSEPWYDGCNKTFTGSHPNKSDFYDKSNEPLASWGDFDTHWEEVSDDYPKLKYMPPATWDYSNVWRTSDLPGFTQGHPVHTWCIRTNLGNPITLEHEVNEVHSYTITETCVPIAE